jgi:hypothetical protein
VVHRTLSDGGASARATVGNKAPPRRLAARKGAAARWEAGQNF